MEADLDQYLKFPKVISISLQRPDIVIYSVNIRRVCLGDQNTKLSFQPESKTSERLLQKIQHSPKICFRLVKSQIVCPYWPNNDSDTSHAK